MFQKLLGSVVFALSLVLSQLALADDWGCREGLKSMVESLKIDEAKKTEVKNILEQLKTTTKASAAQFVEIEKQIKEQVRSDKMDQNAVNGLVDQKTKLIGDIMKAKLAARNQILALLTPEQKAALLDKMQKLDDKISAKFKQCHQDE